MKVHTVLEHNYEDTRIWGVFSTSERAQAWIDNYSRAGLTDGEKVNFWIQEWEINSL